MTLRRLPFASTGADQVDETADVALVRLLRNGLLNKGGRIVRTPGWTLDWSDDYLGNTMTEKRYAVAGAASGRGVLLHAQGALSTPSTQYAAYNLKAAVRRDGAWQRFYDDDHAVWPIEAPRSYLVTIPSAELEHVQMVDTDTSGIVALVVQVKTATTSWQIRYRIVDIASGVVASGDDELLAALTTVSDPMCKSVGPYIVYLDTDNGRLYVQNYVVGTGWTEHYFTASVARGHARFDACYDPDTDTIAVVTSGGYTASIDCSTWAAPTWTDRTGDMAYWTAGTGSIVVNNGYVWIAYRGSVGPAYAIRSWVYPGFTSASADAPGLYNNATTDGIPMLSKGVAEHPSDSEPRVWMTSQVTTYIHAYSAKGSLRVTQHTHDVAGDGAVEEEVIPCAAACSHMLDMGDDGAFLLATGYRDFVRQTWLCHWFRPSGQEHQGDSVSEYPMGVAVLWRGSTAPSSLNRLSRLDSGQIGDGQLGTRSGLILTGRVIADGNADLSTLATDVPKYGAAIATAGLLDLSATTGFWDVDDELWPPDLFQAAEAQGACLFAAGLPPMVTDRPETTIQDAPPKPVASNAATGTALTTAEVYRYIAVYFLVDGLGRLHRGPISDAAELTANGHDGTVIVFGGLQWPGADDVRMHVYRTEGNGSIFYRATTGLGLIAAFGSYVTFTDSTSDADIISRELLYTQGALDSNGLATELGGRLEDWGPPPCRSLWAGTQRLIACGLENPRQWRVSNLFLPGESAGWPEHPAFMGTAPGDAVACAALDDVYFVWTADACWYISGPGPDRIGSGEFDPPRRIPGAPGCQSWRSVLEIPTGLLYQSPDGSVWFIQRGTLQVSQVSANWSEHIASACGTEPQVLGKYQSRIAGSAYLPDSGLCYFTRRAIDSASAAIEDIGGTVVYDPSLQSWSIETETGELGYYCGAWDDGGTRRVGVLTYLSTSASPTDAWLSPGDQYSGSTPYAPFDSAYSHELCLVTGNLCDWGADQDGIVRMVALLASTDLGRSDTGDVWSSVDFEFRYGGEQTTASGNTFTVEPASSGQDDSGRWLYRVAPRINRCSELSLVIRDDTQDAETWWHALQVDSDAAQRTRIRRTAGSASA